jgi:XTP/dITP diphosphohydrolase
MDIVLASRNKKKIEELKKILESDTTPGNDLTVNILTPESFPGCGDVVEDGKTFEANAIKKALYIRECSGMTAVADDSGLEVKALNGAPGIYSARYAGEPVDDRANLEKLLLEMKDVSSDGRLARFVCCIALASESGVKTFAGHVEGIIGTEPVGDNGFGYDPVFYPLGGARTFAEMDDEEKNAMSHRGRDLEKLREYIVLNKIE